MAEEMSDRDVVPEVTDRSVEPLMLPDVAETVVEPGASAVAFPALVIVATERFDEAQVTEDVRSTVLLSV